MSAWDIYWVLQLDSINTLFTVVSILGVVVIAVLLLVGMFSYSSSKYFPESEISIREAHTARTSFSIARKLTYAVAPILVLAALVPSTKTAAAMIVLPAIANNVTIQHEAGDLYKLAKDALRQAVSPTQNNK